MIDKPSYEYTDCYVAFLDILGFKKNVIESENSKQILKILIESLSICDEFSGSEKNTEQGKIPMQSRFFSDTVVFFTKKNDHHITQLFFLIRYLQDRLWEKGICLRGATTIGKVYWPEKKNLITVGPALIEAYKVEKEIAIYPRIVINEPLLEIIGYNHIDAYPFGSKGINLKGLIRKDNDGISFLDLLNNHITRYKNEWPDNGSDDSFSIRWTEDQGTNRPYTIKHINQMIQANINASDQKIRQKYEWLQSYVETITDQGTAEPPAE